MKTFWTRTASAVVYALLFVGSIYSGRLLGNERLGVVILTLFLMFVNMGCTFEFFRMVSTQGAKPNKPLGYAFAALVQAGISALVMNLGNMVLFGVGILIILLPLVFAVTACVQLWHPSEQPFRDIAYTLIPIFYIALPLGLMPVLNTKDLNVLMLCVILVWVNDCFAYMGGSLVGKHKMWPRHSPGKTWEGTAIGVVFTFVVALIFGPMFQPRFSTIDWLVIGFICSVIDTLGDLVESMLKRSVGMKDSGNIMPGHGGFLDRFDSLLIITPFVFIYIIIFCS